MYHKASKTISLVLVLLLLGSVPVYGWFENREGPGGGIQFDPGEVGDTDPDDFPITAGGPRHEEAIGRLGGPGAVLKSAMRALGALPF